jgi:DNA repair protein RadD
VDKPKGIQRLLLCVVSPKYGAFLIKGYDNIKRKPSRTYSKGNKVLSRKEPKAKFDCTPYGLGKINSDGICSKNSNDKMIVLQPSKELLEQNYLKYCTLCGDFGTNAGIYSASFGRKEIAPITYATIGSIKNLGLNLSDTGLPRC